MQVHYKGDVFTYECEIEYEEDNIKKFHNVYAIGRKHVGSMPLGPYTEPTTETFKMWIECGMPNRQQIGGNYNKDIERYYYKWLDNEIDKHILGVDDV